MKDNEVILMDESGDKDITVKPYTDDSLQLFLTESNGRYNRNTSLVISRFDARILRDFLNQIVN